MELKQAIKILEAHNRWRRGEDVEPMVEPTEIGDAIDVVVEYVKNNIVLNIGRDDYNLTVGQIARKISKKFNCRVEYGQEDKDKRSYKVSFFFDLCLGCLTLFRLT